MKHPLLWLLALAVIALGIAGFAFLSTATYPGMMAAENARTPALISGISCLVIATGLLVFGFLIFRKGD